MTSPNTHPSFLQRRPSNQPSNTARDYRLLVESVQTDDLAAARRAYERMMGRMNDGEIHNADTLARIGDSLDCGDLDLARRTLDGLEGKALQVLRGLRDCVESFPRKPN